jgi:hypothetical protein
MKAGMWNLAFGLVAIIGGASGQLTLFGTGSGTWLMVAGGVLTMFGIIQLVRSRGR